MATLTFLAAFALPRVSAKAEDELTIALSPVKTESDGVTYYCFDNPTSVFADGEVKIVAGQNGIYYVSTGESGETEVKCKNMPADKVYRRTTHEDNTEYLIILNDGKISTLGIDDAVAELNMSDVKGDILDFDVYNNKLYAVTATQTVVVPLLETGLDAQKAYVAAISSGRHSKINAKAITAINGKLYISVKAVFGNNTWDVCSADISAVSADGGCKLNTVLDQCNDVLSLTASAENDMIYLLTRGEIIAYTPSVGGGLYKMHVTDGSDITDIFAYGNNLYTLDSLNALSVCDGNLANKRVIAASASGDKGFFNVPFGMTVKSSILYVADTVNNRIAIYDNNGIRYIDREFRTPVSVAADNGGTVYVAYDDNKVGIFRNNAFSTYDEITVTSTTLGKISRIAVDADKTLFILTDNGLWRVERDYIPHRISTAIYKEITLSISKGELYALDDDKVVLLDKQSGEVKSSRISPRDGVSVAVDLNDTAFVLCADKIARIPTSGASDEYALTADGQPYTLGDRMGQLLLCFMENGIGDVEDEQNYAIILDTFRHRILKADGLALNARFVDYSYESPDIVGSTNAVEGQSGIIRKVRFDTPLFDYPIETKSDYTVMSGWDVIVPDYSIVTPAYDPDETPEFALVLVDDTQNHRLLQGYVYKDALSEPIKYSPPPSNICTVTGALGTIVYKWPSRNANAIDGYIETAQNTKFNMLDFVQDFRDRDGYYWYRIALDDKGNEGYVTAFDISPIDYQQANILPDYNAEIIAYNGNAVAKTYSRDEATGKYTEVSGVTLKAGTKVEVVGTFDSSERYTKIKFLDGKSHKTVTCFVETAHLKYTGLNIVLIVAIIVAAITVILAIIIISRVYYSKKKRLDNDGDEDGKDKADTD
ncbi:MAG: hypothetical protein K2J01_06975 [Clostridiales bacterium]|nr:hypothetical protein [Clostridiales bacterium]